MKDVVATACSTVALKFLYKYFIQRSAWGGLQGKAVDITVLYLL